ncbi:MAG: hypothetical protein GXP14_16425 [Gammaproteobacteria bacterium]|nr:hypothetical protein [Gammaproteobacteria bacterium]
MLTKDEFVARNVTVIDFSNHRKIHLPDVYQPQSCVIKLSDGSVDIGSHCYTVRKVDKNGNATKTVKNSQGIFVIPVLPDSLDKRRIALVKKIIEYAAERAKPVSQQTLYNTIRNTLRFLPFYFDQSNLDFSDPDNRPHYEEAARRYSAVVKANKKTRVSSKHILTIGVYNFAKFLFDGSDLNVFDYDIIPAKDINKKGTTPLLADELDLALALRTAIFEGVFDLLVKDKTLPYPLKVPEQCGELNHTIWLGYKPWGAQSYFPRASDFERRQPLEWFDRDKGILLTKEQLMEISDHQNVKFRHHDRWKNMQRSLKTTNSERSNLKLTLAEYAGISFLDMLLSMTGMNQQPALDLPWYGGYFIQKAKQGHKTITLLKPEDQTELEQAKEPSLYLRSIKNRKAYEPVEVAITNRFLPLFKRYLELRNYYLKGSNNARLFPFSVKLVHQKRESLNKAFPEIPKLTAHIIRASVSDSILTATNDPQIAAQILQNDPKTIIKYYAAGTQKGHIQGMGGFFNAVGNQIKITRKAAKNEVQNAVGSCSNGGIQPDPLPGAPIESNCTQQEGCFFCKHFSVHADKIDIRKLFSVLYYINKGATRAHDVDYFNQLFRLVIEHIKDLLKQIEAISAQKKALVARIKDEVFNEEALDDYWLGKLNRLEMLTGDY